MPPKSKSKAQKEEPELIFGTPEWMEAREEELDHEMQGRDFSKDMVIIPQWDGWYKLAIVPVTDMKDWLRAMGEHWGVFPGPDGKSAGSDGCPAVTWNKECPLCFAIGKALAEKKAVGKDFYDKGGIGVQKKFLLRVILLETELHKVSNDAKAPPVFSDLPELKIFAMPLSVAKKIRELVKDKDWGYGALTNPHSAVILKLTKDSSKAGTERYNIIPTRETFEFPEEYFEYDIVEEDGKEIKKLVGLSEDMPAIEDFLPKTTAKDLMIKIEKHARDINPFVANYNLSFDVTSSQKALPSGEDNEEEEKPSRDESIKALREKLGKHRKG